jgi:hypothetical protein
MECLSGCGSTLLLGRIVSTIYKSIQLEMNMRCGTHIAVSIEAVGSVSKDVLIPTATETETVANVVEVEIISSLYLDGSGDNMDAETGNNEGWSEMLENTRLGTVFLTHSDDFTCWDVVNIMNDWRIGWYSIGGSTRVEV